MKLKYDTTEYSIKTIQRKIDDQNLYRNIQYQKDMIDENYEDLVSYIKRGNEVILYFVMDNTSQETLHIGECSLNVLKKLYTYATQNPTDPNLDLIYIKCFLFETEYDYNRYIGNNKYNMVDSIDASNHAEYIKDGYIIKKVIEVRGIVDIQSRGMVSLKNIPQKIGSTLFAGDNNLTVVDDCPKYVRHRIDISNNLLENIDNLTTEVPTICADNNKIKHINIDNIKTVTLYVRNNPIENIIGRSKTLKYIVINKSQLHNIKGFDVNETINIMVYNNQDLKDAADTKIFLTYNLKEFKNLLLINKLTKLDTII